MSGIGATGKVNLPSLQMPDVVSTLLLWSLMGKKKARQARLNGGSHP